MVEPVLLSWTLRTHASRQTAWSILCDTDRLNRLAGLDFSYTAAASDDPDSRGTGHQKHLGLALRWQERPVEFTVPSDIKIERIYENGPVSRVVNTLHLEPIESGTRIAYEVRLWPRASLLRPVVATDVRLSVKPGLTRALQALLATLEASAMAPPDLPPPALDARAERLVAMRLRSLHDPEVAAQLGTFLREAPLAEQVRMRPLALARRWGLPPARVTETLLEAESTGLVTLRWEVLCPACRMASETPRTLSLRTRQSHCDGCDLSYDASIADAIALTFQPVPEIRRLPTSPRCLSSPARVPHRLSQRLLPSRGELAWQVELEPGTYRVRSLPELDVITVTVHPDATRHEQVVLAGPAALGPPVVRLAPGRVTLHVRSKLDRPLTLLFEQPWREPDQLCVGDLLAWPEVAARLPSDAMEAGVEVSPFEGLALVVQVSRGGVEGTRIVSEALRLAGVRALQVSSGWVMATLPDSQVLERACEHLQGALWLSAAVGHGALIELTSGDERMASGGLLQALVGVASEAEPGCVVALEPQRWPTRSSVGAAGLVLVPRRGTTGTHELRLAEGKPRPLKLAAQAGAHLAPGAVIDGRFTLRERLGEGGFGIVFAADDALSPEPVVVKLLRASCAENPDVSQRFFDEGRLAARLVGRHVATVREWGLADDGRLFIAMERLHGRELAEVLRDEGTLDPARTLRLILGALVGLAEAHAQGLVHRDVKPSNLFVVDEGQAGEHLKVIDFGIAIDLTGEVRSVDEDGMLIGTPGFVSPEQVLGTVLDGRSDLYSLGLVLHKCLAGSLPFTGETPMDLMYARMLLEPSPLDACAAQPLPPGLSPLVERVLAVERDARPADALAMALALDEVLRGMGDPATWVASWQAHAVAGRAGPDTRPSELAPQTIRATRSEPR